MIENSCSIDVILCWYSWYPMIRVPEAGLNPMRGSENRTRVSSPLELRVGFQPRERRYCSIWCEMRVNVMVDEGLHGLDGVFVGNPFIVSDVGDEVLEVFVEGFEGLSGDGVSVSAVLHESGVSVLIVGFYFHFSSGIFGIGIQNLTPGTFQPL